MGRELRMQILILTSILAALVGALIRPRAVRGGDTPATYQQVENWAQLPDGGQWGVMAAVAADSKGNVYAFQRAEQAKVMVFDANGKFLKSWGETEFEFPHGLGVAPDGSVWAADKKREQLLKFSPDGKLLMTIGERDVTGDATSQNTFNGLSDMAQAKNGDIFVSDGENSAPGVPPYNNRVLKFSKDGKFVKMWGTKGEGPSEFSAPHCIAVDSKENVWVGDRGNKRLQEFDQDGKFLNQMTQFGAPASIYITRNDVMYIGDGNKVVIGKTDGTVLDTIDNVNDPHGIAVDENTGAVYVAQVGPKAVLKFIKK
jgi:DNA-binding beta-propeller fold protein YncE